LRRRGVPYRIVGGLSFLARKEVKDVLSYWRLVANFKDDASLRRILNWPTRGIGKTSVESIGGYAFENGIPFFEALPHAPRLAPKTAPAISNFRELILRLHEELQNTAFDAGSVANWAKASLDKIQARRAVEEECDDPVQAAKKWENVDELVHSMGQFKPDSSLEDLSPQPSEMVQSEQTSGVPAKSGLEFLREFLNRMTLEAQEQEKDEENKDKDTQKNQVTLLTLHGAKGLEYPIVFMVGMEEGFLPHRRTIEEATDFAEERRLCYVGITRAKDFLFITRAKNRIRYGKPVPRNPSRFLEEIPADLLVSVDQSSTPDLSNKEVREAHELKVKNYLADIKASLMGSSKRPS
jgi:DNA helicase-2/ATP-dependent DNA helicase PcrA